MPNYYRKPVGIDAWRWTPPSLSEMPEWLRTAIEAERIMEHQGPPMLVTILRPIGNTDASPGDWIIREANGDLDACRHDEFIKLYTPGPPVVSVPEGFEFTEADLRAGDITWMAPRKGPIEFHGTIFAGIDMADGPDRSIEIRPDHPMHPVNRDARFLEALTSTINSHSRENGSDTPDFILGQFLMTCLTAFDVAVSKRTKWYQGEPAIEKIVGDNVQLESALALIKEACERAGRPEGIAITDFIEQLGRECTSLNAQLVAEGEHTAAGSAEIARLNTEIERITRRQQGVLAGKD